MLLTYASISELPSNISTNDYTLSYRTENSRLYYMSKKSCLIFIVN